MDREDELLRFAIGSERNIEMTPDEYSEHVRAARERLEVNHVLQIVGVDCR